MKKNIAGCPRLLLRLLLVFSYVSMQTFSSISLKHRSSFFRGTNRSTNRDVVFFRSTTCVQAQSDESFDSFA